MRESEALGNHGPKRQRRQPGYSRLFDYLKPRFRIRVKISFKVGCRGRVRTSGSIRFDSKVFFFFNPSLASSELITDWEYEGLKVR